MGSETPAENLYLAATIRAALAIREEQRAAGATPEEIARNFERTVRAVWPFQRVWKYLCNDCHDTGLFLRTCKAGQRCNGVSTRADGPHEMPGKYSRLCTRDVEGTYEHTYGEPCVCGQGEKFKIRPNMLPFPSSS